MTANEKSLFYDTVCMFEGFSSRPYRCPAGVLTIGFGHTKGVKSSDKVNKTEARKLLEHDFQDVFSQIVSLNIHLQEHEFFAIADFVFNLGIRKFKRSRLYQLLIQYSQAPLISKNHYKLLIFGKIQEFVFYTDKNGVKQMSSGLLRRRKFEAILFKDGQVKPFSEL